MEENRRGSNWPRHLAGWWARIVIVSAWLALVGILVHRELSVTAVEPGEELAIELAEREEYQGVYFREQKIGHVANFYRTGENGVVHVDQQARMRLNVGQTMHQIDLHLQAELNNDATLRKFTFSFESPFYRMAADGEVRGSRIDFNLTTGSNTIHDSLALTGPPIVPTARRSYLLTPGLAVGQRLKVPWFDPVSLTAKDSVVEYRGRERVQIGGRVHNLHKFIENFGGARVSLWLSDEGDVMKEESPAGFVFIKEPKFRALELAESSDELLAAVAVPVTGTMPVLDNLKRMRYRLSLPPDETFTLTGGRQRHEGDVLTIEREVIPGEGESGAASCVDTGATLASTPYIQADSPKITELAGELTAAAKGQLATIQILAEWVYRNLEKRPVLGIPDALTTLENRQGDCNEHAALFAALARASGVPTRIAAGVVYHKGAFYYHAWNEVCVGGRWLSIDTTTNQFPADLSHIKFVEGELSEQVRIGALLGRLAIEPLMPSDAEGGEGQ